TLKGYESEFQAGIDALVKLTDGKVHLSLNAKTKPCDTFLKAEKVEKHWFEGAHPAGVVGIQMHHIDPIKKDETAWTINPQHVVFIGRLFLQGKFNTEQLIAVAGPEIKTPQYYSTYLGAN